MRKQLLLLFVVLCSMAATVTKSYAQDTEFWFAGPVGELIFMQYKGHGGFVFTNPSNRQATVKIEYYRDGTDTTIIIPAYSYNHMYYPTFTAVSAKIDVADKLDVFVPNPNIGNPNFDAAIHITSTVPITAYYIFDYGASQETFMLKGSASLGTKFSITSARMGPVRSNSGLAYSTFVDNPYIAIVGTEDGTNVDFNLPVACTNYPAGPHSVMLDKGKVLYLRSPFTLAGCGSLAGMIVTSDKPVTVTGGEPARDSGGSAGSGGAADQNADQLVTDSYAGNVYVMPLSGGFNNGILAPGSPISDNAARMNNYFELIALEAGTNVQIDWGSGFTPLTTLANAGDTYVSDSFKVFRPQGCATIVSDKPIHIMQNTGHEATTCHIPNFYATNTHMTSFYSYYETSPWMYIYPGVSLIYLDASKEDFTISYPGQAETPLFAWITANARWIDGQGDVPQFAGWKYIRFTLPDAAINQIITIKSMSSVFQLGMTSSFNYGTYLNYLTAFNSLFSFEPDTVYTCPGIYTTLIGGIASWYKWTLPDGSIKEGANLNSLPARDMGMYILDMTQGIGIAASNHIIDTCWVFSTNFSDGTPGGITKSLQKPFKVNKPQSLNPAISSTALDRMTEIRWTIEGATYMGGTSETTPSPYVQFSTTGIKNGTLYMKYETVYPDSTHAECDSTINFSLVVQPETVVYMATPGAPNKVGVNDDEKSDDELFNEGKSWDNPYNLEDALKQAYAGDYILALEGIYTPKKDTSFVVDGDNVTIIGGAKGWETSPEEVILDPTNCIIQGNGNSAVIFDNAASLAHSGSCLSQGTTLKGFTIQGGEAVNGGGILFSGGASGTIAHCIVKNNTAGENGGGIYTGHSTCGPVDPILYNVEISANRAKLGAGMYNDASRPQLTNVTIGGNAASVSGSGMYNAAASPAIRNTIVYGNITKEIALEDEFVNDGGTPAISYSIIRGSNGSSANWNTTFGTDGGHNADKNPIYRRSGYALKDSVKSVMQAGNYRIVPQSPAYNHGYNVYVKDIPMDLDGNDRIYNDIVDMGAYEYWPDSVTATRHDVVVNTYDHVTTVPPAGIHYVDGQEDYMVTFYPKDGYSLQYMTVTTGSDWQDNQGGMIKTVNPDGSVTVIFQKVSQPLDIKIGGVAPTASEAIEGVSTLWTNGGNLYVQVAKASQLNIYTVTGQLYRQQTVGAGETVIPLAQGVYVVTLDNGTKQKIIIK